MHATFVLICAILALQCLTIDAAFNQKKPHYVQPGKANEKI